jgi:extracellular factor (EF) 3-hydroxypalmitic acid methyl ester biosynthesis protein
MTIKIENFFDAAVPKFTSKLEELQIRIAPSAAAVMDETYVELTDSISEMLRACRELEDSMAGEPQTVKEIQQRFREKIAQWFDRSWFMHRAKTKPRGYPGDYLTLTGIYDRVPKSLGLGGYLDLYFLHTELGRAVPDRLQACYEFLVEEFSRRRGDVSVLNVACGPFREYAKKLRHPADCSVKITCIDSDKEALDFVRGQLQPVSAGYPAIELVSYNALRMSSVKANLVKFGWPDIIYSIGLCDYIPDDYLIAMLQGWRESLNDNGVVYVAFKDTRRYAKTEYHWLVDWFFLPRTEEECRKLYELAGYDMDALEMTRDATGILMNFTSRVKTRKHLRIDDPELQRRKHTAPVAVEEAVEN